MDDEYKFDESEAAPTYSTPADSGDVPLAPTEGALGPQQPAEEGVGGVGGLTGVLGGLKGMLSKFNLDKLNWKAIAKPALIVLAILVLYMGFSFYSSGKQKTSDQDEMMAQMRKPNDMQMQPVISPPVDFTSQSAEKMQTMQQNMESMAKYMADVKDYIAKLDTQASSIQQEVSIINQNIEQITMALQHVFLDVEKLKNPPKKIVRKKKVKVPVAYYVRAIVPGRVWLDSVDGKSVTLRVGDKLEGYGEVRMISPRQGMVVMSNGSIIQYGVNDV